MTLAEPRSLLPEEVAIEHLSLFQRLRALPAMRLKRGRVCVLIALLLFALLIIKDAWVTEDAYITLRTVFNFTHGYGLTWNVGERVQAYTHPLWMFLLSGVYVVVRNAYWSALLLSIATSCAAGAILAIGIAHSYQRAVVAITILAASKAYVDFSTSGLENPLTHLFIVLFALVYFRWPSGVKRLLCLALLAGLATFNRMDTGLMFLPALAIAAYAQVASGVRPATDSVRQLTTSRLMSIQLLVSRMWASRQLVPALLPSAFRVALVLGLGFIPLVAWEVFATWYYGFPFPNTAYAKLHTGISHWAMILQGLKYVASSYLFDQVLILGMIAGISLPFITRNRRSMPLAAGALLYIAYAINVGGDFMAGRFFTAPFLFAVIFLAHDRLPVVKLPGRLSTLRFTWKHAVFAMMVLGVFTLHSRWLPDYSILTGSNIDDNGVADERDYYVGASTIWAIGFGPAVPHSDWIVWGEQARMRGAKIEVFSAIGFYGFAAGPSVHIVDPYALADPLLARLPAEPDWRIGHYRRLLPDGYIQTIESGHDQMRDAGLGQYYDKLRILTQGNLMDPHRLVEIWKFNTGQYDYLLNGYDTELIQLQGR